MMNDTEESLQSIRVIVEAKLPQSGIIVVTSATEQDGPKELAYGLASAFGDAGRHTALVSFYPYGAESVGASFFRAPAAPAQVDRLIKQVQSQFEVVIVASPPIVSKAAALQLCRVAEGVVLAVRLGRRVMARDHDTIRHLQSVSAKILGVVATRSSVRRTEPLLDLQFARESTLETVSTRVSSLLAAAFIIGTLIGGSGTVSPSVAHHSAAKHTATKAPHNVARHNVARHNVPRHNVAPGLPKSIVGALERANQKAFNATLNAIAAVDEASKSANSILSNVLGGVGGR